VRPVSGIDGDLSVLAPALAHDPAARTTDGKR
jgi:hypothetical protein